MTARLVQVAPSDLDESYIGVHVEVEHHGGRIAGVVSDVVRVTEPVPHLIGFYPTSDGLIADLCLILTRHTHLTLGGQHAVICHDPAHCSVQATAPTDPCDGTELVAALAADAQPKLGAQATAVIVDETAEYFRTAHRPGRARGTWLTVLAAAFLFAFGICASLAAPPLSGAAFAGLLLAACGGALGLRLLYIARHRHDMEPTP